MPRKQELVTQTTTLDHYLLGGTLLPDSGLSRSPLHDQSKLAPKIRVPATSGQRSYLTPQNVVLYYPCFPSIRDYQQQILISCVVYNTLVCLPTGLGKTHIAAVLIDNFARWFPTGKIFFLAPSRPLVAQQRHSLKSFSQSISENTIFQMNGNLPVQKRVELYKLKRIIFATPQTFENDLLANRIDAKEIVLIIFDECHHAVGFYSYTKIVKCMDEHRTGYRIVGLSACPGKDKDKIQQVINNLHIRCLQFRDSDEPDVRKYLHQRLILTIKIGATQVIKEAVHLLDKISMPFISTLIGLQLVPPWRFTGGFAANIYGIKEDFDKNINLLSESKKAKGYNSFAAYNFLVRRRKELLDQGYETFRREFFRVLDTQRSESSLSHPTSQSLPRKLTQQVRSTIIQSPEFAELQKLFGPKVKEGSHPKLKKLKQILQQFLERSSQSSKIMVFSENRTSLKEIKDFLDSSLTIKCELFYGQAKKVINDDVYDQNGQYSNTISSVLYLSQKKQLALIDEFKKGDINTLISTSIGEEGLDIGEIDCIVCYDGGYNHIRNLQRIGRTGRKRDGVVYVLLMEGNEEKAYQKGVKSRQKIKEILRKKKNFTFYPYNSTLFDNVSEIPIIYYGNTPKEQANGISQKQTKKKVSPDRKKKQRTTKRRKQQQNIAQKIPSQEKEQSVSALKYDEEKTVDLVGQQQEIEESNVSDITNKNNPNDNNREDNNETRSLGDKSRQETDNQVPQQQSQSEKASLEFPSDGECEKDDYYFWEALQNYRRKKADEYNALRQQQKGDEHKETDPIKYSMRPNEVIPHDMFPRIEQKCVSPDIDPHYKPLWELMQQQEAPVSKYAWLFEEDTEDQQLGGNLP